MNVNNPNNDVPVFYGDLYFAHGPNPTAPTLTPMTVDSTGYYSVAGIDFADDDFFSFAVKNELFVEFSSSFSNSQDETTLGAGVPASVVDSGIVNVATSYIVTTSGTGVGLVLHLQDLISHMQTTRFRFRLGIILHQVQMR